VWEAIDLVEFDPADLAGTRPTIASNGLVSSGRDRGRTRPRGRLRSRREASPHTFVNGGRISSLR